MAEFVLELLSQMPKLIVLLPVPVASQSLCPSEYNNLVIVQFVKSFSENSYIGRFNLLSTKVLMIQSQGDFQPSDVKEHKLWSRNIYEKRSVIGSFAWKEP